MSENSSVFTHMWSEDEVDLLVHLYKNQECLWNTHKPAYYNSKMREAAFASIKSKMFQMKKIQGLGPQQIIDKILSLQNSYLTIQNQTEHFQWPSRKNVGKWYLDMDHIVKYTKQHTNAATNIMPLMKEEPGFEASSSVIIDLDDNSQDKEIHKEVIDQSNSSTLISFQSRLIIMNVLKRLYISKVTQSYKVLYDIIAKVLENNDEYLMSEASCRCEMTKLGYIFKETIDGKKIIIEDPVLRFERYLYMHKIRQLRTSKKPIIYIDERIINSQLKFEKLGLKEDIPDSSLMFLAITREGVLSSLFSSEATESYFNKWVTDILLTLLLVPSVIVMDNSPIHGKLEESCQITRYSTKNEMLKWLTDNNIPCSFKIDRPLLFELIRQNRRETKEYKIDRIIRSHGHEVLRLPKTFSDLNMTNILWNFISMPHNTNILKEAISNNCNLQMLQILLVDSILPTIGKQKWYDMEKALIMKENDVYQIDTAIESLLETYIFM